MAETGLLNDDFKIKRKTLNRQIAMEMAIFKPLYHVGRLPRNQRERKKSNKELPFYTNPFTPSDDRCRVTGYLMLKIIL